MCDSTVILWWLCINALRLGPFVILMAFRSTYVSIEKYTKRMPYIKVPCGISRNSSLSAYRSSFQVITYPEGCPTATAMQQRTHYLYYMYSTSKVARAFPCKQQTILNQWLITILVSILHVQNRVIVVRARVFCYFSLSAIKHVSVSRIVLHWTNTNAVLLEHVPQPEPVEDCAQSQLKN